MMRNIERLEQWVAQDRARIKRMESLTARHPEFADEYAEDLVGLRASLAQNETELAAEREKLARAIAAPVPPKGLVTIIEDVPGTACTPPVPAGTKGRVLRPVDEQPAGTSLVQFAGEALGFTDGLGSVKLFIPNYAVEA